MRCKLHDYKWALAKICTAASRVLRRDETGRGKDALAEERRPKRARAKEPFVTGRLITSGHRTINTLA